MIPILLSLNRPKSRYRLLGFTLIELLIAVAIVAIIVAVALPTYQEQIEQACIAQTQSNIKKIEGAVENFYTTNNQYPDTLADTRASSLLDCWDQPFRYLNLSNVKGKGKNRKDRSENPINTDYDLYSVGADGKTRTSLRPKVSHDDIIRARNGKYVGLAANY